MAKYSAFYPGTEFSGIRGSTTPILTEADLAVINSLLDGLTDDSIITIDEKIRILIPLSADLEMTYSVAWTKAQSLGISTFEVEAARTAWITYRDGLTPAWNDITADTTIVRATFRQKLDDYLLEIRNLQAEISGQAAITGYLTNESHLVAADAGGNVSSFTGAGGTFKVHDGQVDVTLNATFAVESATNVTISINTSGVYTITAMSGTDGTAILSATYNGLTVTKTYSISKVIGGANAILIYLSSSTQTIPLNADGSPVAPDSIITFTATKQNTTATVTFSMTKIDGTAVDAGIVLTGTGDTRTLTHTDFNSARGLTDGIIVSASITVNSVTLTDKISVVRVQQGANGTSVKMFLLVSDRQTIAYDTNNVVKPNQTVNLIGQRQNTTANIIVELYRLETSGALTAIDAGLYLTGSGTVTDNTPTSLTFSQTGGDITLTTANFNTAIGTGLGLMVKGTCDGIIDQVSIVKVKDGSGTFIGILSNEAHTVATDSSGVLLPGELALADGFMDVYYGSEEITSGRSFTVFAETGVTGSTIDSLGEYQLGTMSADTATVTLRVTGTYSGFGYDVKKVFTVTKVRQGPEGPEGPPGPTLSLSASEATFNYIDGIPANSAQTITVTAIQQNTSESINWSSSPTVTLGAPNGTSRTLTITNFGTLTQVEITAIGAVSGAIAKILLTAKYQSSSDDSLVPDSEYTAAQQGGTTWQTGGNGVLVINAP